MVEANWNANQEQMQFVSLMDVASLVTNNLYSVFVVAAAAEIVAVGEWLSPLDHRFQVLLKLGVAVVVAVAVVSVVAVEEDIVVDAFLDKQVSEVNVDHTKD